MALALIVPLVFLGSLGLASPGLSAEPSHRHEGGGTCAQTLSQGGVPPQGFEGVQIETSALTQHELLFERILKARPVFKVDHPQVDHLRGYCYRDVLVVIRQDLKAPKPSGWVQVNFAVADVEAVKVELERNLSGLAPAGEEGAVGRLRLKPDVPRSNCRVARLELSGPEGFMIGFDQFKPGTCK